MLARERTTYSAEIISSLQQVVENFLKGLMPDGHEDWAARITRYSLSIIVLVLCTFWLVHMDPRALLVSHQIYLMLAGITTTVILGVGPGILAVVGLLAVDQFMLDMDLNRAALHDTTAAAWILALANVVALKSSFWRARAERQAVEATRLTEQLKLLTDGSMHYALYMTDQSGHIVHWNQGAERFTGRKEDEVIGRHVAILYDRQPGMAEHLAHTFAVAAEHGGCEFDSEFIMRDGTTFMQNCVVTALHDDNGEIQGFANLARDVTLDREREVQLQENEAELSSILGAAPEAVFGIDEEGRIDYINKSAGRVFGYDLAELRGKDFNILFSAAGPSREPRPTVPGNCGADASPRHLIGRRRDGSNFPIEMTFVEVERLRKVHSTAFIRDLTEQEATKARLEQLQAEMLHGTRYSAMGAMASMLSHELNQPLTAVAAYMEGGEILLKREEIDRPKLQRAFRAAADEAIRAGAIMRRLRSFVSDGEAQLEVHDIDEVIETSVALVRATAEAAAVEITLDIDEDAGPIFADPIQIQQVIGNLCRNAIDAMRDLPERVLTIEAKRADDLTTHILIKDTGPGVPPDIQDRIFDAFVSQKSTGTGVGLSICRTIVEAHGGHIWVSTTGLGGSCFGFSLKRKEGA